jgi:hypothetical protein
LLFDDGRILFFDTHYIDSMENVKLTLNPPAKRGACLVAEKDWEKWGSRACNVIYWNGEWRLYYMVSYDRGESTLAFVTSKDGINWERPSLGAFEFNGSKDNNLCTMDFIPGETCVFIDPTGPDEYRFKMVCHKPQYGQFLMTSPDGINWKREKGNLLWFGTDNNMSAFYDETIGKYRVYCRGGNNNRPVLGSRGSRTVFTLRLTICSNLFQ